MEHRHKATSGNGLTLQNREDLERLAVRLLEIAARCENPAIQYELMQLADELVRLIEQ